MFGRFAEQSTFTSCEPKAPVEVCNTEVTTLLLTSRRASIGSTYNCGKDIVATPAVSEVDARPKFGMLSCSQKRETNATLFRIYHSNRESSETLSSHVLTSTVRPAAMCSQKRKSSRDSIVLQVSFIENERINSEHREIRDFPGIAWSCWSRRKSCSLKTL